MLTSDQLNSLLIVNESDRLKFTTATDYTDKFSQAVCAFANDFSNSRKPGFLLIGVDGKGRPSGMKVTDKLLQNLGTILPLPSMEVYSVGLEGGDIAVEEVHPSDLPPVRYKGQVWIRVGPRKAIASDHEERILTEKRIARVTSFDVSPVREASLADLSLPIFHEYRQSVIDKDILERNHRTIEEQLAGQDSLRLSGSGDGGFDFAASGTGQGSVQSGAAQALPEPDADGDGGPQTDVFPEVGVPLE
jgi:ATP-dependent DNA helicase RecG